MNQRPTLLKPLGPASLADEEDFQLGEIWVRPSLREVGTAGMRESLEPRVMQVLVALARANGAVLSRDELIRQCWGGRIVGEDAINRCVSKVRQLSELGGGKAFEIETIPRVGYRLIRSVSPASAASPQSSVAAPVSGSAYQHRWPRLWTMLGLGVALLLILAFVAVRFLPAMKVFGTSSTVRPTSSAITLAVLPFTNMSGNRGEEYFSDGMTEEVNGALSNISGLHIIARRSAFQFKNQNRDVRSVTKLLGATHVVEGSIRKEGSHVRVSAQLIRGADGVQVWAHTYDRSLTDIFAIQEEIASSIAEALRIPLGLNSRERLVSNRTRNLYTYEQYLRARALYRGRHVKDAISILAPAVQHDPNYAPAHSLLAMIYCLIPVYLFNESDFHSIAFGRAAIESIYVKVEVESRAALRLDPHQSEAYVALGCH